MLNHLPKSDSAVTITKSEFINKVDKVAQDLSDPSSKSAFLREKGEILTCVKNGTTVFDVDRPGNGPSDGISLKIIITPNTAGGRRSKTRRTKKGKRKGRGRKTRQRK
jgi:hypothetical protein